MANKTSTEQECVVVPIAWFERLLKMSDELDVGSGNIPTVKQAALQGYIRSATHIIKYNKKI